MGIYKQEPPFAVQIEFTEGCNLYCSFCGLQGIREKKKKDFKFLTYGTANRLAQQIRDAEWTSRIEFAMHGEPTMHPNVVDLVKIFNYYLPNNQLMMTSNGGGLLRAPGVVKNLTSLFDAGLNIFAFDAYDSVKIKEKVMGSLLHKDVYENLNFDIKQYPQDNVSPHSRYPKKTKMFIKMQDISAAERGTHSILNNHCGAAYPPLSIEARCAKPFRELSVRWNGKIAICCNDWRGVYKIGNINKFPIYKLWNSDEFNSARKFLMLGDRASINPCKNCDAKSYRVGLLPDKKGKIDLSKPTARDRKIIHEATLGRNYTKTIKRPWEK
jgi:radical SAM protein with 4Fe4S-binding SPASM domain